MGDDVLRIVLPYGVIESDSDDIAIERISKLVKVENFSLLIFGLPIGLDGHEGVNAMRVRKFGDCLVKQGFEIKYIDERFTSREADRMGGQATRDEKAAMLILESYFGSK